MTKPQAKVVAASKTASTTDQLAAKPSVNPDAPKPAAKPAAKPAIKPAAKPTVTAHPAVASAAPAVAKVPVKTPTKTPAPARPSARAHTSTPVAAPASPPSNRFTDRFAPARPAKSPDPIEVQKSTYKADPKLVNAWKTKAGRDLTEPELLAMPDDVYMNDKQLDFFRARLQALKDDLLSNAGETTEHLREDTSIVPDPADRATIEEEHALELRTRDRERKLLKKIAQSLTRLDSGEYGFCDETGEPIGLARLMARPTATLSLEAQQRRELKQKMFGD